MGPTPGVCHEFQFGKCAQSNHHEKPNGEFLLHICQPCYQIRQDLVHHTCAGRHPGHHGGERRVGAVGCPSQVSPEAKHTSINVSTSNNVQTTNSTPVQCSTPAQQPNPHRQVGDQCAPCKSCGDRMASCRCVFYTHTPDALCTCDDCARFVRQYHFSLETLCRQAGVTEFDLYSTYYDYHGEETDDDSSDDDFYSEHWDSVSTISSATIGNESFFNHSLNQSFYSGYYNLFPY